MDFSELVLTAGKHSREMKFWKVPRSEFEIFNFLNVKLAISVEALKGDLGVSPSSENFSSFIEPLSDFLLIIADWVSYRRYSEDFTNDLKRLIEDEETEVLINTIMNENHLIWTIVGSLVWSYTVKKGWLSKPLAILMKYSIEKEWDLESYVTDRIKLKQKEKSNWVD